ncbi:hypothetical protein EK21DRAFT_75422 [Setomelanomma holmii]|uniref:Uncharacterized protein n=1 Tax=Setomelanomma holmii TaxID=210430 RepID=A0A9P4H2I6_9PLEO|nr:hypothetical protein EK21DRAFT_75422 [Setomelanomma holmii]
MGTTGQPVAADDFLQHSLIFHDTLLSSQIAKDATADQAISPSSFLTTSFDSSTSNSSSPSIHEGPSTAVDVSPTMDVKALDSIPSAQYLRSIYPQTPTRNVVCVLMTHPERREIFVRKSGYKMDLYEITVADDTSPAFKISIWLRPPRDFSNDQANVQQVLLQRLKHMRVGDILLMRNIALTSFRDTVYGQSLNPQISRARTTIDILTQGNGTSNQQLGGLPPVVVEVLSRLKRWARNHVAVSNTGHKRRRGLSELHERLEKWKVASSLYNQSLPPDTLESI